MKLEKILDSVNSLEKNSFLKIIDNIKSSNPKNSKEIDKILSDSSDNLKSVDSINIAKVFDLIKDEFAETIKAEFINTTSQLDILIDIIIKDGNNILKQDWFARLYEKEIAKIKKRTKELKIQLESDKSEISETRKRDYLIYKACVETAYNNDYQNNRESKITDDELSILLTLTNQLDLSQEEVKLINYLIIPPDKSDIENITTFLKNIGVIFYSRKNNLIYVADEVVRVLRKVRKKEIADKYYRRVLKTLKESQINLVCRKHSIDTKELDYELKIKQIIKEGIPFSTLLKNGIHKDGTNLTDRKKTINDIWNKGLKISSNLKGSTLEEKIENIISYFNEIELDEKVGISVEGYEKLLLEINDELKSFRKLVLTEFEMPEETNLNSATLLDFNIKPRDVLDILSVEDLKSFIAAKELKSRGDLVLNILDAYKDAENLLIENYVAIGFRNLNLLKENGITIKESELGLKFECITQKIFEQLGFNVDESLKKKLNTTKNKIDLVLNLGNNDVIIVECKTIKESGYNKFSSVSRQIKSYVDLAKKNGLNVVKSLLVAPDFSDDFVNDCDLEFEINLSLITAGSLVNILEGFRESKHKQFPYQLLMKDVLIKEERILKAIKK
ncbi:hypothetical protein SAMN05444285_12553 [Draconibacterium orientale]|uniref:Uncharacterized protein n=1 Tax=Draconibacterium orientale TaxID=1168034 RepID=X5DG02_9BACT|nr:hypothetical protein [Draconibacterium orientale]AHW59302.1 hypothetical protein FH5T_05980 [Draconibacterium orientale]SET84565.1 hypothetical protein SAMN05444285_12553 [Draconibacterium orientale]